MNSLLSLLNSTSSTTLTHYSLSTLNTLLPSIWIDCVDHLPLLLELYGGGGGGGGGKEHVTQTQTKLPLGSSTLLSLIISKLYYYLNEYTLSLEYAIQSSELYFNDTTNEEYKQKINQVAIDSYPLGKKSEIVERILAECSDIGLLVECGRFDLVDAVVKTEDQIEYALSIGVVRESFLSVVVKSEELRVRILLLLSQPLPPSLPLSLSLKYSASSNNTNNRILLTRLKQEHLFRNQHTDFTLLRQLKLDSKHSILHQSMNILHSLSTLATTNDSFLRENIEWLSRANNWSRFFATSQLGMVHCMNIDNYKQVLSAYLPGVGKSKYVEGGSLYAYGMCSSSVKEEEEDDDYLVSLLDTELDEIVSHGLLLGLGCKYRCDTTATATANGVIDKVKHLLYLDSATIGESSGVCLGMIKYQSKDESLLVEMRDYLRETQHEKIQRGLAIGIGMIGSSDSSVYYDMIKSELSIERYSGVLGLGLSGTSGGSNNNTLQVLLNTIVSDSDDDVRRIGTICVGLVLRHQIDHLLITMKLLIDSYNPSVRYGACIALAIGVISNRGDSSNHHTKEILSLLEKCATSDSVDFVRQGAFIAIGMVCQLGVDETSLRLRQIAIDAVKKKHEDHLVKLGACICIGMMDMAGRNGMISLESEDGMIGFVLFLHYWWWFPLLQMVYMCVDVQMVVLIDEESRRLVDKSIEYECRGYVEAVKEEVKSVKKKDYVELSVSKALSKESDESGKGGEKEKSGKEKEKESSDMDVDTAATSQKKDTPPLGKSSSRNFARIFKNQKYYIDGKEYKGQGVVVMRGCDKFLEFSTPKVVDASVSEGGVKPPEEFEYTE